MAQIRAQRRLMLQKISQDILIERKKEAERAAKMAIIEMDDDDIIHEHEGVSADEDHSSVMNSSRKESESTHPDDKGYQIEVGDLHNNSNLGAFPEEEEQGSSEKDPIQIT